MVGHWTAQADCLASIRAAGHRCLCAPRDIRLRCARFCVSGTTTTVENGSFKNAAAKRKAYTRPTCARNEQRHLCLRGRRWLRGHGSPITASLQCKSTKTSWEQYQMLYVVLLWCSLCIYCDCSTVSVSRNLVRTVGFFLHKSIIGPPPRSLLDGFRVAVLAPRSALWPPSGIRLSSLVLHGWCPVVWSLCNLCPSSYHRLSSGWLPCWRRFLPASAPETPMSPNQRSLCWAGACAGSGTPSTSST